MARVTRSPTGYSLIELMMVVAIMGVVSAIALFQVGNLRPYLKGDGAMRSVIAQMNTARELSIAQRRNIQISFAGNVITLTRQDIPVGTTTVLAATPMEDGVQFVAPSGVPDLVEWTADGYTVSANVFFSSDGSLIGASGQPVNNLVFMTLPNQPRSLRAVTVFGATGRIRGYKWDGGKWLKA